MDARRKVLPEMSEQATYHPGTRPECTTCGSEYTSAMAAAECCDPVWDGALGYN
ncbi:hypothetical protein C7474_2223 [Microbacterium telephonicum]|uniref:Uncharacterized protein n=1 Tax=Microbacterium telephonicum TaxID=1714841 RepID=A0A498C394_9MICO|nr:hypothetical protein C7474_2223 [Microbacterium telephonicum]